MNTRLWRTELRHGVSWAQLSLTLLVFVLPSLLVFTAEPRVELQSVPWQTHAALLRLATVLVVPVAVGLGVLTGGRERRARLGELLAGTPRPVPHRALLAWAVPAVAWLSGLAVAFAVGAAVLSVRFPAGHVGTGWCWELLSVALTPPAGLAVGHLLGRVLPGRWTSLVAAPCVALAVLFFLFDVFGGLTPAYGPPLVRAATPWVAPLSVFTEDKISNLFPSFGERLAPRYVLASLLLHAVVAGVALLLATAGRRLWSVRALVPAVLAALAVLGAGTLVPVSAYQVDPNVTALVCAPGTPRVCVLSPHRDQLDATARAVRPILLRLRGVPGAPVGAVEVLDTSADTRRPIGGSQLELYAGESLPALRVPATRNRVRLVATQAGHRFGWMCFSSEDDHLAQAAAAYLLGLRTVRQQDAVWASAAKSQPLLDRLWAADEAQRRDWFADYLRLRTEHDRRGDCLPATVARLAAGPR